MMSDDPMNDPDQFAETDTEDTTLNKKQPKLFRLSSRISSLKRRGKFVDPKLKDIEFDYFADDNLTIRGPGKDFYVAKVLEDVPEDEKSFNVAWYDVVKGQKNKYKVSYDDIVYRESVLTRVHMIKDDDGELYHLSAKSLKETQEILKESLFEDGIQLKVNNTDIEAIDAAHEDDDSNDRRSVFEFPSSDSDNEPPTKKARVSSKKTKTPSPKKRNTPFKEKKTKKSPRGKSFMKRGLIPNPDISLLDTDPVFGKENNIPLMPMKQGIRAVLLRNKKELEKLTKERKAIYTLHWHRSVHLKCGPLEYAVLQENRELLSILLSYDEKQKKTKSEDLCAKPQVTLQKRRTGSYDFCTFGHPVHDVAVSRGNKEGNNAFLCDMDDENSSHQNLLKFALKKKISFDFIQKYVWGFIKVTTSKEQEFNGALAEWFHILVKYGHYKLAENVMEILTKNQGFGFNFLHLEVLNSESQPLSKFKSTSVTKKPFQNYIFPLHCACINPNVSYLKQLTAVLPEYNIPSWCGSLPIHYAAACEGDGPLKFLLSRGVDPTSKDRSFTDPLMIASKYGRVHNIHALMKCTVTEEDEDGDANAIQQINIHAKNRKGMTSLHYAAKRGHVDCVNALLDYGANIDIQATAAKENATPLVLASMKGHYDVFKVLLNRGANPNKKVRRKKTALIFACINGHSQIVAHLLHLGVDPNSMDSSDNTPIHYAAAYGWYHCVQLLLEAGADPSRPNNWKTTPFEVAIGKNHIEICDLLMNADIDVDFCDEKGQTLLMKQMTESHTKEILDIVKFLVYDKKAGVSKQDIYGWNALHHLASYSIYEKSGWNSIIFSKQQSDLCLQLAEVLTNAGIKCNDLSEDGDSPLIIAIKQNNFPLVDFLLEHGANPNIGRTKANKETALIIAIDEVNKEPTGDLTKLYSEYLSLNDIDTNKHQFKNSKIEVIKKLITKNADLNCVTEDGITPLMKSFSAGEKEICVMLLEKDADPRLGKISTNQNALQYLAGYCGEFDTESILKQMSGKYTFSNDYINAVDHNGMTALHIACVQFIHHYSLFAAKLTSKLENISSFIKTFLQHFENVNVLLEIGKKAKGDNLTFPIYHAIGFTEDFKNNKDVDAYNEYGVLGLFTVPHLLAMQNNRLPLVLKLVLEKVKDKSFLNKKDRYGRSPIHVCIKKMKEGDEGCYEGFDDVLKLLIANGADVNSPSNNEIVDHMAPSLCLATRKPSFLSTVRILLSSGVNVNQKDSLGRTALSYAVENENQQLNLDVVKELLHANADLNSIDNEGRTALHYAINATSGGYEILTEVEELMIRNGAKRDIVDNYGRLPLHYAFSKLENLDEVSNADPISIVKLLCDVQPGDLVDTFGHFGDNERVGKYINYQDKSQRTPLHYAALRGATLSCLHLRTLHSDDDLKDIDGNTPLSLAVRGGHNSCSMMLVQQGAKADNQVITPVTKADIEVYEKEVHQKRWCFDNTVARPETRVKASFQLCIENDWQGVAYLMLEYANLPFLDAYIAALLAKKTNLLYTLLRQQRDDHVFHIKTNKQQNLLHLLALYCGSDEQSSPLTYVDGGNNGKENPFGNIKRDDEMMMSISEVYDGDESNSVNFKERSRNGNWSHPEILKPIHSSDRTGAGRRMSDRTDVTYFQIAKLLGVHSINPIEADYLGCLPIHYAAQKCNFTLINHLLQDHSESISTTDNKGRSPLAYLIETIKQSQKCTKHQGNLIRYLVEHGASLNVAYETDALECTSILNSVIKLEHDGLLKGDHKEKCWLENKWLENKFDVNLVTSTGVCALATAIKLNFKLAFDTLMTLKADVTLTDIKGNTLIHYCVQPLQYGSYENVGFFGTLTKAGALVNIKNEKGEYPMDLISKQGYPAMKEALMKSLNINDLMQIPNETKVEDYGFEFSTSTDLYRSLYDVEIERDLKEQIDLKMKEIITKEDYQNKSIRVNPALQMEKTGVVYCDDETHVPYDATLTKVDMRYGTEGLYLFYKLQLVYNKGLNLWILFNQWGRIGRGGQHQQTPFHSAHEAVFEFKKIFKSKTGNEWKDLKQFVKKPKKYALVSFEKNPENLLKKHGKILDTLELEKVYKSKLPTEMKDLMKEICNISEINEHNLLQDDLMPLGLISREQIQAGEQILQKIRAILEQPIMQNLSGTVLDGNQVSNFEKIYELGNEYYMLLPPHRYSFGGSLLFESISQVDTQERNIKEITKLSFAARLLLAASIKSNVVHPFDYVYTALNCRIESLDPNCNEARLIIKKIHTQGNEGTYVKGIYRIKRFKDNSLCGMENRCLLWHGTKRSHLLSILHDGLLKTALHSTKTGSAYGKGIYFSHSFDVSRRYCDYNETKHILLCDVAMGTVLKTDANNDVDFDEKEYDSKLVASPDIQFDSSQDVTMPYGSKMHLGKFCHRQAKHFNNFHNEIVVFDESRVRIRYLIQFKQ